MDNGLYVAFSGLRADMRALDLVANNLANVTTNGFREERSFVEALDAAGASYPMLAGARIDAKPGPVVGTGRELDVAVEGNGYLVVDTPAGRRYTRDGALSMANDGTLETRSGLRVVGQGGAIVLSKEANGKLSIDADGRVMLGEVQQGRILLVDLPEDGIVHEGQGLSRLERGAETPSSASLRQGFLEKSNVELPTVDLLRLERHFQALGRALAVENGLARQLISTARGQ
jgi:flagellar basal-body rod protein FlgF